MAREHGSRILNWWRRLKTCDRLALVVAIILAAAVIRDMPASSDDGLEHPTPKSQLHIGMGFLRHCELAGQVPTSVVVAGI